jgi:hypothetical protein
MGHRAAAGLDQQAVDVPVIAAGKLDDAIAARKPARQSDRAHRGFRARADHPHAFDGWNGVDHHLGQFGFRLGRSAEACPLAERPFDRLHDFGMGVPEDQRSPRADVIEIPVLVDVDEKRPLAAIDERRLPADSAERPGGAVHSSRD